MGLFAPRPTHESACSPYPVRCSCSSSPPRPPAPPPAARRPAPVLARPPVRRRRARSRVDSTRPVLPDSPASDNYRQEGRQHLAHSLPACAARRGFLSAAPTRRLSRQPTGRSSRSPSRPATATRTLSPTHASSNASPASPAPPGAWTWAPLMRRVFDFDVLTCPRCGGRLRVLATVEDLPRRPAILAYLAPSGPRTAPPRVTWVATP